MWKLPGEEPWTRTHDAVMTATESIVAVPSKHPRFQHPNTRWCPSLFAKLVTDLHIYIYIHNIYIYIYCLVSDTYIYLVVSGTETKLTSLGASPRCAVYGCIQLNDDFAFYGPRFEAWNHGWRAIWDWTFLKLLMGSQSHLQSIKSLEEGITKVIDARKSSVPRSENCHHHEGDSPQHHGHINWLTPWKLGPRLAAESNPVLNDLIIAGETSHYNVCMCVYIYISLYIQ